ncbi:MAG: peptidase domain-containing ABC transporter [Dinghuibacter sp.]|nr:peptidase domain-containing ABC transporter [Dinghuibacter sp.]
MRRFPIHKQLDTMDCGPACLLMIAEYYGGNYSLDKIRDLCYITKEGVSLLSLGNAAEKMGFLTASYKVTLEELTTHIALPCVLFWEQKHFVVLPPQNLSGRKDKMITIADPAKGLVKMSEEQFLDCWAGQSDSKGFTLAIEKSDAFPAEEDIIGKKGGLSFLYKHLEPYKKSLVYLMIWMLLGNFLTFLFPLLTQSLVDHGVNKSNPGFITLILISQLVLFASTVILDFIRNWLLLHMSSRINISIVSDFLHKLMRLPIQYFDTKMTGDISQRINDHNKIERFLTVSTINTFFSFLTLIIFSIILATYSTKILLIFIIGSILSVLWMLRYFKKRKELDYKYFQLLSENQSGLFELITGMQEIKLNNCETRKRWEWEKIQANLFHTNVRKLALEQSQQIGHVFFTQLKNILISYITAIEVLNGNMTLGMMLSVSYITGQLNSPIEQLLGFFRSAQDAQLSMERLKEIHNRPDEEKNYENEYMVAQNDFFSQKISSDIEINDLSFHYGDPNAHFSLANINLKIPQGKVTAIVGSSGSGKTTLLKLLLGFYEPVSGFIMVGNKNLSELSPAVWRSKCGVVMQEGYIFSDTIANNISVSDAENDRQRIVEAASIANISHFAESLPLGYDTRIGSAGNGLSTGQKQRFLIARAIYKNPEYIFFDEATSALDTTNERKIMDNLQRFFTGKTVVVIAHRLSTVKNADHIVVMENGQIVEMGNHERLTSAKGKYYELVKNQLELGE